MDADNVQLRFDHENDTDDMMEGQEPLELAQHQHGEDITQIQQ